jgi:hypothetical protein
MKRIATFVFCSSLLTAACHGQGQAAQYQAAAQLYFSTAAKCPNPAGAACMMALGRYSQCQAAQLAPGGPPSCTAPTCSTSCLTSGGAGVAGAVGSAGASKLANAVGTGMQLYQLGKAFGLFGSDNSQPAAPADNGPTPEQLAAQAAAAQAAHQQQINADATNILNEANSLLGANNTDASQNPPDTTSQVCALLGNCAATTNQNLPSNPSCGAGPAVNAPPYNRQMYGCIERDDYCPGTYGAIPVIDPGTIFPYPFSNFVNKCGKTISLVNTLPGYAIGPASLGPNVSTSINWYDGVIRPTHIFECEFPKRPAVLSGKIYVDPSFTSAGFDCIDSTAFLLQF